MNWNFLPILEVCEFEKGTEPGSESYNRDGMGIPFIRVGNIGAKIQEQIYTTSENVKICKKDDILIALDGSPGIVIRGLEGAYSSGIRKVIVKDSTKLMKEFVYYYLQTDEVQKIINEHTIGVTIKHAGKSLNFINIPIPPISVQKKIVKILDTVQKGIEIQEKIIEKTKEIKKSLMADLFKYGAPSFRKNRKSKKTEIGEIPEDWKVVRLGEVCEKIEQKNPANEPLKKIVYIDVSSLDNEYFKIVEHKEYLGKEAPTRARKIIKFGDVIFATVRPYLKRIALVPENYNNAYCSTAFCVIRPIKEKLLSGFIFYFLTLDKFVQNVSTNQHGSGYPAITDNHIYKVKIPLPSLSEQKEIAEILSVIDEKIEIEKKKKELYEELFKSLLNKIMNGEIDVEKIEL
ncbi:MAG TPA: restriction endonuclease subunit S [bacterium]|nr:restriction endonuclease subunit S [bacterium]HOM27794.1 restriction endonuclease subunit S [bacterium]